MDFDAVRKQAREALEKAMTEQNVPEKARKTLRREMLENFHEIEMQAIERDKMPDGMCIAIGF